MEHDSINPEIFKNVNINNFEEIEKMVMDKLLERDRKEKEQMGIRLIMCNLAFG